MLPTLFISHGSPMLAVQPGASGRALEALAASLPRPTAVVVISAHWQSAELAIGSHPQPPTWHDFGGFPPELYRLDYPAPGEPQLALSVQQLLQQAAISAQLDPKRRRDHGVWVPLRLLYPQADIPVVQLSLPRTATPESLTRLGRALAPLRQQQLLIVGSGSITHNLGELDWRAGPEQISPWAQAFRDWMVERLAADDEGALHDYRRLAPHAVRNHPTDEHLLPLFVARGAGGRFAQVHSGFTLGALGMDIYRFD